MALSKQHHEHLATKVAEWQDLSQQLALEGLRSKGSALNQLLMQVYTDLLTWQSEQNPRFDQDRFISEVNKRRR